MLSTMQEGNVLLADRAYESDLLRKTLSCEEHGLTLSPYQIIERTLVQPHFSIATEMQLSVFSTK